MLHVFLPQAELDIHLTGYHSPRLVPIGYISEGNLYMFLLFTTLPPDCDSLKILTYMFQS